MNVNLNSKFLKHLVIRSITLSSIRSSFLSFIAYFVLFFLLRSYFRSFFFSFFLSRSSVRPSSPLCFSFLSLLSHLLFFLILFGYSFHLFIISSFFFLLGGHSLDRVFFHLFVLCFFHYFLPSFVLNFFRDFVHSFFRSFVSFRFIRSRSLFLPSLLPFLLFLPVPSFVF